MRRSRLPTVSLLAVAILCGCTRANDVLEPSAIKPETPAAAETAGVPAPASQPATTASPGQAASTLAGTRLQIAPIVGATVEAATPLTERLAVRARERGITLAGSSSGQTPTLVLKGYFSAVTEGVETTVIYVWDVYDPAGNRLHRINGQQKAASAGGGDGWPAVTPSTMQAVADSTIDQLATWLSSRSG